MDLLVFRAHPVPLDGMVALPEELDGSQGDNRLSQAHCQIQADNDWQAIQCWLAEFEDSPQTHRNYRKEAERLLLWSIKERRRPISSLLREGFQAYQVFLANPQPETYWCGPRSRGIPQPGNRSKDPCAKTVSGNRSSWSTPFSPTGWTLDISGGIPSP